MMKVVIAGGSGFLGRPLAAALAMRGADVAVLTRGTSVPQGRPVTWNPASPALGAWAKELDGADAVVNLAGEVIAERWTDARKAALIASRLDSTRRLADAILAAEHPPAVFASASAVGYYGARGDEVVTESDRRGSDFLADLCARWEAEAARASANTRVVHLRTGLALERGGGALAPMLLPFTLGVGGPVGSGRQYWPWIHRQDWIELVIWTLTTATVSGAVNVTAPRPVTSAEFARALGRAIHRPAILPTPAFALRLLFGEMADVALLAGQRAVPDKAERLGFAFRYQTIDDSVRRDLRTVEPQRHRGTEDSRAALDADRPAEQACARPGEARFNKAGSYSWPC